MAAGYVLTVEDTSPTVAFQPAGDPLASGTPDLLAGWAPYYTETGFADTLGEEGSGTSLHLSSRDGAVVSVNWTGTGVQLYGNATQASYDIAVDGKKSTSFLSSPEDNILAQIDSLPLGDHTIDLTVHPNSASSSSFIAFDKAVVNSTVPASSPTFATATVDDLEIAFHGHWSYRPTVTIGGQNESFHRSWSSGDEASLTFVGTAISVVGYRDNTSGTYNVSLDGASSSLNAQSSFMEPSLLFVRTGLDPSAEHKLLITNAADALLAIGSITLITSSSPSSQSGFSHSALIGTTTAAALAVVLLALLCTFLAMMRRRRRRGASRSRARFGNLINLNRLSCPPLPFRSSGRVRTGSSATGTGKTLGGFSDDADSPLEKGGANRERAESVVLDLGPEFVSRRTYTPVPSSVPGSPRVSDGALSISPATASVASPLTPSPLAYSPTPLLPLSPVRWRESRDARERVGRKIVLRRASDVDREVDGLVDLDLELDMPVTAGRTSRGSLSRNGSVKSTAEKGAGGSADAGEKPQENAIKGTGRRSGLAPLIGLGVGSSITGNNASAGGPQGPYLTFGPTSPLVFDFSLVESPTDVAQRQNAAATVEPEADATSPASPAAGASDAEGQHRAPYSFLDFASPTPTPRSSMKPRSTSGSRGPKRSSGSTSATGSNSASGSGSHSGRSRSRRPSLHLSFARRASGSRASSFPYPFQGAGSEAHSSGSRRGSGGAPPSPGGLRSLFRGSGSQPPPSPSRSLPLTVSDIHFRAVEELSESEYAESQHGGFRAPSPVPPLPVPPPLVARMAAHDTGAGASPPRDGQKKKRVTPPPRSPLDERRRHTFGTPAPEQLAVVQAMLASPPPASAPLELTPDVPALPDSSGSSGAGGGRQRAATDATDVADKPSSRILPFPWPSTGRSAPAGPRSPPISPSGRRR